VTRVGAAGTPCASVAGWCTEVAGVVRRGAAGAAGAAAPGDRVAPGVRLDAMVGTAGVGSRVLAAEMARPATRGSAGSAALAARRARRVDTPDMGGNPARPP
jgi:hypothetical protein